VRRDAELGAPVHLLGAHLDLDRLALGADDRGVQRLVEVELGRVDVVLEAARHRRPQGVDRPEHGPAVAVLLDHHTQAHEVEDLVELLAAHDHLLVDAPEVLGPPAHVGLDAEAVELGAEGVHDLADVLLALGRAGGDHLLDLGVLLGVQRREAQVLELPLDLLDPEAVRQRGVDVERLLGDGALARHRHHRDRTHVVQPVRELDEQYAPVVGHGDEHLADGGCLLGLLGVELQAVELGDAVDDGRDLVAELLDEPLGGDAGVLDGVVQQGGRDGRLVEPQVRDDARHGDGVGHVGFAGAAQLALVGVDGGQSGAPDQLDVAALVVLVEVRDQPLDGAGQLAVG
jgi:hypothetical protein